MACKEFLKRSPPQVTWKADSRRRNISRRADAISIAFAASEAESKSGVRWKERVCISSGYAHFCVTYRFQKLISMTRAGIVKKGIVRRILGAQKGVATKNHVR
jgi:hypothetical protein